MNEFDEHRWSPEQRTLDGQIAAAFEGLEGSRALAEGAGIELQAWQKDVAEEAARVSALVAGIEHDGRRNHWRDELARIGALVLEPVEEIAPSPPDPAPAMPVLGSLEVEDAAFKRGRRTREV
jgi:hypothetical protein